METAVVFCRAHIQKIVAVVALCLTATLTYVSTLHDYFLADDFGVVQSLSQKPLLYFPKWFVTSWMDNIWGFTPDEIRPFPAISFQFTSLWGAASPAPHHIFNVALHALNTLLVFAIARQVAVLTLPAATFAGMLFAVLPVHAETVAWITGRVDSIPALFYLSSFFAYARWRRTNTGWFYKASVVLFFLALFSKQTAVTMLATLVLYDMVVERRPLRLSWPWLRDYVPFALLTVGYLMLRYALFGQVLREGGVTAQTLVSFSILQTRHVQKLVFGTALVGRYRASPEFTSIAMAFTCLTVALTLLLIGYVAYVDKQESPRSAMFTTGRLLLYFGPVWWLVGTLPTAVAGYETARHLYLGAVGYALVLGLGFDALAGNRARLRRSATVVGSGGLVLLYVIKLQPALAEWHSSALLSTKMVGDVERQAAAAPVGSLLLLKAPVGPGRYSDSLNPHYVWAFALPFALQPPFSKTDLTARVFVVSQPWAYCCPQWFDDARHSIRQWAKQVNRTPAIALHWDAATGELLQKSEVDNPGLRHQVLSLADAKTFEEMEKNLHVILGSN
jgi:hypothetical protein